MPSEKYAARRGGVQDGLRVITACFARALQRWTSRMDMHFLHTLQEVVPLSETCNQLMVMITGQEPRLLEGEPALGLEVRALGTGAMPARIVPDTGDMAVGARL